MQHANTSLEFDWVRKQKNQHSDLIHQER